VHCRFDAGRPALALSAKAFNKHGHSVLAMITSASHHPWPGDTRLEDLKRAGLTAPSLVRMKTVHRRQPVHRAAHR
jgi:mRNA interferase MazF